MKKRTKEDILKKAVPKLTMKTGKLEYICIMEEFAKRIKDFINDSPVIPRYRDITDFLEDAARRRMEEVDKIWK
jgi:hypothetical protein